MQVSQHNMDALGEQISSLYKNFPSELRTTDSEALKTIAAQQSVLISVNDHIAAQEPSVVLGALKFTILSVLYQEVQRVLMKQPAAVVDLTIRPVPEQHIKEAIRCDYPAIYSKLLASNKSVLEILGEHRNMASKLFCAGTKPRSLRMFDQWIARDTKGVSLHGVDDPRSDDDFAP